MTNPTPTQDATTVFAPAEADPDSSAAATPSRKPNRPVRTAFTVAMITVLTVGMAGFVGWWVEQRHQQMRTDVAALMETHRAQLMQLSGRVERQEQELTAARQQLGDRAQQTEALTAQLQEQLRDHEQQLQTLVSSDRNDWLLAEAEYLLKLANRQLLLERSPTNAIALLKAADRLLEQVASDLSQPELFAVRATLANDLVALTLVEPVDREGIYLQLHALADTVDDLPRVPSHSFTAPAPDAPATDNPADALEDGWQRFWRELKEMAGRLNHYIKIENVDAPARPLMDQYTAQAAALNVRLLLEQAQAALLQGQAVAYQLSLQQARTMISDYFIVSPQADEVGAALTRLEQVAIAPSLPDIATSLAQLQDYLRQSQRLPEKSRSPTPLPAPGSAPAPEETL